MRPATGDRIGAGGEPAGIVAAPTDPRLEALVAALLEAAGGEIRALLLYGSHVQASEPDRHSAYDLIIIVDAYRPFYHRLSRAGLMRRPPSLMAFWSHILMPTSISFEPERTGEAGAKCQVLNAQHFRLALGPHAPDHFLKGRTVQRLAVVAARSPAERERVLGILRGAREDTVRWVRPYLPGPFTAEEYARAMLRVSYGAEIRPEGAGRVEEVYVAQRDTLLAIARQAIEAAVEGGEAVERPGGHAWTRPPGTWSRWRTSAYFTWSKARATARWLKHLVTFEDWPVYIVTKLERRAGLTVQVTERERRWPFVLLWPKLFRVLRALNRIRRPAQMPPQPGGEP